jgi:hypothetical protein
MKKILDLYKKCSNVKNDNKIILKLDEEHKKAILCLKINGVIILFNLIIISVSILHSLKIL